MDRPLQHSRARRAQSHGLRTSPLTSGDVQGADGLGAVCNPIAIWALSALVGGTAVFMWIGFGVSL